MKFCIECGKKLSDAAKFCDGCGTKVMGSQSPTESRSDSESDDNAVITVKDVMTLLDDDAVERVKNVVEGFKEDTECDRIHIMGEEDFDDLISNFIGVIKKRGGDEEMANDLAESAIALIDNSKTGQGKRGTLITRIGFFVIDKEIPNYEDGEDDDGSVPWALFVKFGMPVDDENYSVLDVGMLTESDEVKDDAKEGLDYSDGVTFFLRFSQTGLSEEQITELADSLKSAVDDSDEEIDEEEEDDDDDDGEDECGGDEDEDEEDDDDDDGEDEDDGDEGDEDEDDDDDDGEDEEEDDDEDGMCEVDEGVDDKDGDGGELDVVKKTPESEAEVLREIRSSCEEYFHNDFPANSHLVKGYGVVEKLTGEFFAKKLRGIEAKCGDVDDIRIVVSTGSAVYPVLKPVVSTWKEGGLFKKAVKGIFFVWHNEITDMSIAITLDEFKSFLNSNGLEDISASANWIAAAASSMDIKALRENIAKDIPWFLGAPCDVNYNLRTITFDDENKVLVLKVESRDELF